MVRDVPLAVALSRILQPRNRGLITRRSSIERLMGARWEKIVLVKKGAQVGGANLGSF